MPVGPVGFPHSRFSLCLLGDCDAYTLFSNVWCTIVRFITFSYFLKFIDIVIHKRFLYHNVHLKACKLQCSCTYVHLMFDIRMSGRFKDEVVVNYAEGPRFESWIAMAYETILGWDQRVSCGCCDA